MLSKFTSKNRLYLRKKAASEHTISGYERERERERERAGFPHICVIIIVDSGDGVAVVLVVFTECN